MTNSGVRLFIDDMKGVGIDASVEAELVVYRIQPVDGAHAGSPVDTGVSIAELTAWPQIPPHWVHISTCISFPRTNSQPSPKPGWLMHSRDLQRWGEAPPGVSWAGHVRAILGEANG